MSDAERVLYYLAALVAAFAVAYLAGQAAGPHLGQDPAAPAQHVDVGGHG